MSSGGLASLTWTPGLLIEGRAVSAD